jgi:hypothetical protein
VLLAVSWDTLPSLILFLALDTVLLDKDSCPVACLFQPSTVRSLKATVSPLDILVILVLLRNRNKLKFLVRGVLQAFLPAQFPLQPERLALARLDPLPLGLYLFPVFVLASLRLSTGVFPHLDLVVFLLAVPQAASLVVLLRLALLLVDLSSACPLKVARPCSRVSPLRTRLP